MLLALGAASLALDAVKSLTSSNSSAPQSSGFGQTSANPFDFSSSAPASPGSTPAVGSGGGSQISPATMNALLAAQSQLPSGSTTPASTSRSAALQSLFSQIDGNGDGQITKSEFENALGAGGTNIAKADDVFSKLDKDGSGTVSLGELSAALKGAGKGGHHHHAAGSGGSGDATSDSSGSNPDSLLQALQGTSPAAAAASSTAASSYNLIGQAFQRQVNAISFSAAPLSFNV